MSVGGHDDFDVGGLIEAVHLIKQLQQNTLDFSICACLGVEPLGGYGIDFINEDDGGGVFSSEPKHVADHAGAFTEVFLDEFATYHADEGGGGAVCDGFHQHGFSGAGWAVEEHTSGRVNANLLVEIEMCKG